MKWITLLILMISGLVHAQQPDVNSGSFADINYYLIDSLVLDALSKDDRDLIEQQLKRYHEATADTVELDALADLIFGCMDDGVWPAYNDILKVRAEEVLANNPTPKEKTRSLHFLSGALNNKGYILMDKGNDRTALELYLRSLNIAREIDDRNGVAYIFNNIAYIYLNQGDVKRALEYFHENLKVYEEMALSSNEEERNSALRGEATTLHNIGYIYVTQDDLERGLECYENALEIRAAMRDKQGIALSLNNIAFTIEKQRDLTKALMYYKKAMKIRRDIGDKNGLAISMNNVGRIHEKLENFEKAIRYYNSSFDIYAGLGDKKGQAESLESLGELELKKGNLKTARDNLERTFDLGNELGNVVLISQSAALLSRINRMEGKFKESLELFELHIQMRDSTRNADNQKAVIRQQTKYEFEKVLLIKEQEEKEVARIEMERTSRRDNLQYSIVLIGLLVLGGVIAMLGKLSLPEQIAEGLIFFAFLILFEFLLVLADPYVERWTGGAPGLKLLINAGIAALIFPLHAFFESRIKKRLAK